MYSSALYCFTLYFEKKISLERKVAKSCLEFPNILYLGPLGFRFTVSAFLISLLSPTVVSWIVMANCTCVNPFETLFSSPTNYQSQETLVGSALSYCTCQILISSSQLFLLSFLAGNTPQCRFPCCIWFLFLTTCSPWVSLISWALEWCLHVCFKVSSLDTVKCTGMCTDVFCTAPVFPLGLPAFFKL